MKFLAPVRTVLDFAFRRARLERELDEELRSHLQNRADDLERDGLSRAEAERQARIEFGGFQRYKEECRDALGTRLLGELIGDVRYGLRQLRRSPGFTIVALLSLALGIGANTAIFSLIDTLMLRRLPVREPEQLVEFLNLYPGDPPLNFFSWQSYEYFRDHNHLLSGLTGVQPSRFNVRGEGLEPEAVDGEGVVGNFFQMLGVKPAIGRLIGPGDDRVGAADSAAAVVSWSCWKTKFNSDPAILGRRIVVEDVPVTIVGVTPRQFFGVQVGVRPDIWVPLAVVSMIHRPSPGGLGPWQLVGRLKPGVSIKQARAEMAVLFRWTLEERTRTSKDPLMHQLKFAVEPAGAGLATELRYQFAKPLVVLMAVVGLLLLIACTNLANMLLARVAGRQREMALRVSLGAGRWRLVRQLLTESVLLSAGGGGLGILLAYFGADALVRIMMSGRRMPGPRLEIHVQPDVQVLLFTAGLALLTGVLFGLAPAWHAFTSAPALSLREVGRAGETSLRRLFGKSLVVIQVALSVVLLSSAGVFVGHLWNLQHLDLGFRRDHVLLVTLDPARSGYKGEQLSHLYQEMVGRLEAIPGVRSATLSGMTPISGAGGVSFATVEGHQEKPEDRRYVSLNWVAPKYFQTLGTPFLAGRDFTFQDQAGPRVAIVNQAMARYYFADGDPIGKHFTLERDWKGFGADKPYEIVGMVADTKYSDITEATKRTIYFNAFQDGAASSHFALWTRVDPAVVAPEVRRLVREAARTIQVAQVTTLDDQVDASIVPERLIATLSGVFGALGALLAAIGIYGLLAYRVARRISEIGVRMALGATRSDILWMVLGDALGMVLIGLILGAPIAFWAKSVAASIIADLPAKSAIPITLGAVAMIVIALVAAYVPARRATRVDPVEALRYE